MQKSGFKLLWTFGQETHPKVHVKYNVDGNSRGDLIEDQALSSHGYSDQRYLQTHMRTESLRVQLGSTPFVKSTSRCSGSVFISVSFSRLNGCISSTSYLFPSPRFTSNYIVPGGPCFFDSAMVEAKPFADSVGEFISLISCSAPFLDFRPPSFLDL